jgi:oligoendopeptidase F
MATARRDRWMDIYENRGKRSGAYSGGCYDGKPYILLNHQDNLKSAFTLAHELGHSMHTHLSNSNQPHRYSRYTIFVAEVASTLNEALLFNHLMATSDDPKLKAFLLNQKCEAFKGTVFRQTMFAEFEKIVHHKAESNVPLTPEELCSTYRSLNQMYHGPEVVADPLIAMEWSRIPHFYYDFYVYKYATGFSAAQLFANRILSGDEQAREKYLQFLAGGCSQDPLDLLSDAGVDLSTPSVIQDALKSYDHYLDELEPLLLEL